MPVCKMTCDRAVLDGAQPIPFPPQLGGHPAPVLRLGTPGGGGDTGSDDFHRDEDGERRVSRTIRSAHISVNAVLGNMKPPLALPRGHGVGALNHQIRPVE